MQDALRRSQRDMFLGGGSFTDMMERDALAQAQNWIHQTLRHMGEARRMQPQVSRIRSSSLKDIPLTVLLIFGLLFPGSRVERYQYRSWSLLQ